MAKWITVGIVAALLFAAGLFAGHRVSARHAAASAGAVGSAVGQSSVKDPISDALATDSFALEQFQQSIAQRSLEADAISFVRPSSRADRAEFQSAESHLIAASSGHRAAILQLIQRHLPGTEAHVAEIWVQTYADMDLGEVEFILEQKRWSSTASGTDQAFPAMPQPLPVQRESRESDHAAENAVRMVTENLHGAWSLGFRRMAVFPDVVGDLDSSSPREHRRQCSTCFRSFESGSCIQSPIATHVALPNDNSLMFCLDDHTFTRRGDFQMLADRRLGIVCSRGEHATAHSVAVPENAAQASVAANGTIHWRNSAGETGEAGRITVCRVTDLSQLQTDDGVFFTAPDASGIIFLDGNSTDLQTKTLEQSNVDRSQEELLLMHLRQIGAAAAGEIAE